MFFACSLSLCLLLCLFLSFSVFNQNTANIFFAGVNQMGSKRGTGSGSLFYIATRTVKHTKQSKLSTQDMICNLYDCNWALIWIGAYIVCSVCLCVCVCPCRCIAFDADAIFPLFWLTDVASNPIKGISGNKFMMWPSSFVLIINGGDDDDDDDERLFVCMHIHMRIW